MGQLWYMDASGKPAVMRVRTGITDGQRTQVSGPPELHEGLEVLQGVLTGTQPAATSSTTANPFQPAPAGRRGP
jgi:hypothetical protein